MGLGCSKATPTLHDREYDSKFDNSQNWFHSCLQKDLQASTQYTNVRSVSVLDGCTVAIARRNSTERKPKKVFVKCHNNTNSLQFDSVSARAEAELLNRLSSDDRLCKHLPRLERTIWLQSKASPGGSEPVTESNTTPDEPNGRGIAANRNRVLMLEFDRRAGNLLSEQAKEGMRLSERQAADMCVQLLRVLHALHALHLHHGHISATSLVLTSGPPVPRAPPTKGVPLEPMGSAGEDMGLGLMHGPSTLSSPRSRLSMDGSDGDTDGSITDEMTSWLLPGLPHGVPEREKRPGGRVDAVATRYDSLNAPDSARSVFDAAAKLASQPAEAQQGANRGVSRAVGAVGESRSGAHVPRGRWRPFEVSELPEDAGGGGGSCMEDEGLGEAAYEGAQAAEGMPMLLEAVRGKSRKQKGKKKGGERSCRESFQSACTNNEVFEGLDSDSEDSEAEAIPPSKSVSTALEHRMLAAGTPDVGVAAGAWWQQAQGADNIVALASEFSSYAEASKVHGMVAEAAGGGFGAGGGGVGGGGAAAVHPWWRAGGVVAAGPIAEAAEDESASGQSFTGPDLVDLGSDDGRDADGAVRPVAEAKEGSTRSSGAKASGPDAVADRAASDAAHAALQESLKALQQATGATAAEVAAVAASIAGGGGPPQGSLGVHSVIPAPAVPSTATGDGGLAAPKSSGGGLSAAFNAGTSAFDVGPPMSARDEAGPMGNPQAPGDGRTGEMGAGNTGEGGTTHGVSRWSFEQDDPPLSALPPVPKGAGEIIPAPPAAAAGGGVGVGARAPVMALPAAPLVMPKGGRKAGSDWGGQMGYAQGPSRFEAPRYGTPAESRAGLMMEASFMSEGNGERPPIPVHVRAGGGGSTMSGYSRYGSYMTGAPSEGGSSVTTRSHRSRGDYRPMGEPYRLANKKKMFDAAMAAGASRQEALAGAGRKARKGSLKPNPSCPACRRLAEVCTDCRLRAGRKGLPVAGWDSPAGGGGAPGKKGRGKKGGTRVQRGEKAGRATAAAGERPVHVLLHMHGVTAMEHNGGARMYKVHKDVAAVGLAVLLAITGEDKELAAVQKCIGNKINVTRDPSWLMLSPDARKLLEGLMMEHLTPEEALEEVWLKNHVRHAARAPQYAMRAAQSAFDSGSTFSRGGRRSRPGSVASSKGTVSSPLTVQHVPKPPRPRASSPRLPRRESGASLASQASRKATGVPRVGSAANMSRAESLRSNKGLAPVASSSNMSRAESGAFSARGTPLGGPNRTSSGGMLAPVNSEGSFLAPKITEERIDEKGKKHGQVTTFVMPARASSGAITGNGTFSRSTSGADPVAMSAAAAAAAGAALAAKVAEVAAESAAGTAGDAKVTPNGSPAATPAAVTPAATPAKTPSLVAGVSPVDGAGVVTPESTSKDGSNRASRRQSESRSCRLSAAGNTGDLAAPAPPPASSQPLSSGKPTIQHSDTHTGTVTKASVDATPVATPAITTSGTTPAVSPEQSSTNSIQSRRGASPEREASKAEALDEEGTAAEVQAWHSAASHLRTAKVSSSDASKTSSADPMAHQLHTKLHPAAAATSATASPKRSQPGSQSSTPARVTPPGSQGAANVYVPKPPVATSAAAAVAAPSASAQVPVRQRSTKDTVVGSSPPPEALGPLPASESGPRTARVAPTAQSAAPAHSPAPAQSATQSLPSPAQAQSANIKSPDPKPARTRMLGLRSPPTPVPLLFSPAATSSPIPPPQLKSTPSGASQAPKPGTPSPLSDVNTGAGNSAMEEPAVSTPLVSNPFFIADGRGGEKRPSSRDLGRSPVVTGSFGRKPGAGPGLSRKLSDSVSIKIPEGSSLKMLDSSFAVTPSPVGVLEHSETSLSMGAASGASSGAQLSQALLPSHRERSDVLPKAASQQLT